MRIPMFVVAGILFATAGCPRADAPSHDGAELQAMEPLPEPSPGPFSCIAGLELRTSCRKAGEECTLESPPGYWKWGRNRGARLTDEDMKREIEEVSRRALPACLCSCSDEFKKLKLAEEQRRSNRKPVP